MSAELNALESTDRATRLFEPRHPLHPLVAPTFHTVRRSLRGLCISAIWIDADLDPDRAGFRPSYDGLHGAGSMYMMPFIATWMSTGPGSEHDGGNMVLFPEGMDPTVIEYARRIGTLGSHRYISTLADLKQKVRSSGMKLYSIDDVGRDFDDFSMISSELSIWLNTKDTLKTISSYAPSDVVKDMYEVTLDDYHAVKREGCRVFLKTCNTESAGLGVQICEDEKGFSSTLEAIRTHQARFHLNRTLVVQSEILGTNRSFQVFLDPDRRDEIQVVALTNQFVESDGKTYKGSANFPINAENVSGVGPVIMDMVSRVWARYPQAFGFLMCDFFETPEKEIVVYDPGIRPTGNTATAMVHLFATYLFCRNMYVSNFFLDTGVEGLTFEGFSSRIESSLGGITDPEVMIREGRGVTLWGWNHVKGRGILIGIAEDHEAHTDLVENLRSVDFR